MKLFVFFSLALLVVVDSAPVKLPVEPIDSDLDLLNVSQEPIQLDSAVKKMFEDEKIVMEKSYPKAGKEENEAFKQLGGILSGDLKKQFEEMLKDPKKWKNNKESYTGQPGKPWKTRILEESGSSGFF